MDTKEAKPESPVLKRTETAPLMTGQSPVSGDTIRRSPKLIRRSSVKVISEEVSSETLRKFRKLYEKGHSLGFTFYFCDLQMSVCQAWMDYLPDGAVESGEVRVRHGKFEEIVNRKSIDCICSTSNSFGIMNQGFDKSVLSLLGAEIETSVQKRVISEYGGEQPVGTSFIIQTRKKKIPFLIHAPTMRVHFSIRGTDNVYCAMKALSLDIKRWNQIHPDARIRSAIITGMGSFYGGLSPSETARQMVLGYLIAKQSPPTLADLDWSFAKNRQSLVRYGGYHSFVSSLVNADELKLTKEEQELIVKKLDSSVIKHAMEGGQRDDHASSVEETTVFGDRKVTQHRQELRIGQGGRTTRSGSDCLIM